MGDKTAIEWADATWNPIVGCSRVSPGCQNCYAIGVVHRQMSPQHVGLTVKPEGERVDWTGEIRPVPHMFDQPTRWKRPRRIFVNSLSDLFAPEAIKLAGDDGYSVVARIVAEMVANPRHTFQVLTKRPQIMRTVLGEPMFRLEVNGLLLDRGCEVMPGGMSEPDFAWPRHIWWGTSIELDKYAFRADHLRRINGVRWISAEPLLGPLPSLDLTGIDWVVAGGESGPGARPMHPQWVRDLRDACQDRPQPCEIPDVPRPHSVPVPGGGRACACEYPDPVAFLFKQHGDWSDGSALALADVETRKMHRFDDGEVMYRVGKKAAGRVLDGRTWDEYPDK